MSDGTFTILEQLTPEQRDAISDALHRLDNNEE